MSMEDHSSDICLNESMDEIHSFLDMELEALQSIYINELKVEKNEKYTTVSIDLHPSTADKLDEQYVRMTLEFMLEEEYPEKIPDIKIRNPRGLSEEKLNFIVKDLLTIAENKKGNSMLFEMIDAAKEHLTDGNRPSGECAICLYGFSENDVFTKTECYHYFHTHCLARYTKNFIENSKDFETDPQSKSISSELLCPMCRIPIQFSESDGDYLPPEESDESSFVLTEDILEMQKKMADLYMKQMEKGGIIDIEAEKNKYLLEISNVPSRTSNEESSEQKLVADVEPEVENKVEASDQVDSPSNERKEHVKERYQRHDYRGKNRNYNNRYSENRGNHRYDQKFNRHSYDNSRGSYRTRPVKNNQVSSRDQSEESDLPADGVKDFSTPSDAIKSEDMSSQDVQDNASEASDHPSADVRSKHNSSSPRYNRGYRRGNSYGGHDRNSYVNYSSHPGHRRSDKSNYYESQNPQASHRYSSNRNAELSAGDSEERCEKDQRTYDDGGENRRPNYRASGYKHDDDFHSRDRYSDNRNPQRGGKGAYNRRDNYSYASNNYPRNRYSDRDQYQAERDNFRGRRNYYRDNRHRGDDKSYFDGHNKQSSRNYSGNRRGKYTDKSHADSSSRECNESVAVTQNQISDSNASYVSPVEHECSSKRFTSSSEIENKSLQIKEVSDFGEKCSDKLTDAKPAQDGTALSAFPNVFNENPQVKTRAVNPPPGFANPLKKVIYGLQGANPPPGFRS